MNNRVLVAILAVSLVANLGMGVLLLGERVLEGVPGAPFGGTSCPDSVIPTLSVPGDQAGRSVSLQGPAVVTNVRYERQGSVVYEMTEESGTMITITAQVIPGQGRVLVQTTPLMGIVFQDAANTAVAVARDRTGAGLRENDFIFSIESPAIIPAVDGPSAGALMTAITEAAITGQHLRENRTITGTIRPDGSIGRVGGILEKAQAAEDAGKDLLLLPRENAELTLVNETFRNIGGFRLVERTRGMVPAKEYIESTFGIRIEYVSTISDVEEYLLVAA